MESKNFSIFFSSYKIRSQFFQQKKTKHIQIVISKQNINQNRTESERNETQLE